MPCTKPHPVQWGFAIVNSALIVVTYLVGFTTMCFLLVERQRDRHYWYLMRPDLDAIRPIESRIKSW